MLLLKASREQFREVEFSPDGNGLLVAGKRAVYYWPSIQDRTPISFGASYGTSGFVAGGAHVVVSRKENGVWTYPCIGGEGTCFRPNDRIQRFVCSPVDPLVIVYQMNIYSDSGRIYGCRIDENGNWSVLWDHPNRGITPFFSPDGKRLMQGAPLNGLIEYDPWTGAYEEFPPGQRYVPVNACFNHDHSLAAGGYGNVVSVTREGQIVAKIQNDSKLYINAVAFHPAGWLASAGNDGSVKYYDPETWRVAATFDWKIGRLKCLAFNREGSLAAAGSDRGKIVVWDVDL